MSLADVQVVVPAVRQNYENMSEMRTMSAVLAGVAAGVLGLTSLLGALFFVASSAIASVAILHVGCGRTPQKYFPKGSKDLFSFGALLSGAMTYVLVWTVAYDAVYIF